MITLHFERPELPAWAREVALPWMKMCFPPEHDPWPGSRTIGRWPLGDGVEQDYIMRGTEGAREYFWAMQDVYARSPWIWVWEGPNEPYVKDQEHRVMLSVFSYQWARLMRDSGLRTAVYSLAEGNPEVLDEAAVMELALGLTNADYLALHEYSWPTMQTDAGWRCLRYRKTCEIWRRNGVKVPPVIIGEVGIDGSTVGRGGWQDAGISEEEYIAQLDWYAAEIAKDGIECACVFTATPNPRWYSYEVTESLARKIMLLPTHTPHSVGIEPQLPQDTEAIIDIEQRLGDYMQAHIIPQNPLAAFYAYGRERGWEPISAEIDWGCYRAQVWYSPEDQMQHVVYAVIGQWDKVAHFDRAN